MSEPNPCDSITPKQEAECILRTLGSLNDIDATTWNRLNSQAAGGVLSSHAMLMAFETSGSVCQQTGWQPHHLVLDLDGQTVAAIPMYAKGHSYGEFVFDWAWADAYERHGLRYYPKWLGATPFTPVTGPRILCDPAVRPLACEALMTWVKATPLSSMHLLYTTASDQDALIRAGCLPREHVQFHWTNQGWGSFEEFLTSLSQEKRKKIRAERRKVAQAGIRTRVRSGKAIEAADWDFFYTCYQNTYALRGNTPYLTRQFFEKIGHELPDACLMVTALEGQRPVASALSWLDITPYHRKLYGRYWGCVEMIDCLHFEVAYYSIIDWAIAHQIDVIEGGAQGQHKMARGFLPVQTRSAHWLAHPGFYNAVQTYLAQESQQMNDYTASLRSPFKSAQFSDLD